MQGYLTVFVGFLVTPFPSWSAPSGVPRNPGCARGVLVLSSPGRGARGKGPHLEVVPDAVALADLLEPLNSGVALAELSVSECIQSCRGMAKRPAEKRVSQYIGNSFRCF